jgi:type I restriction enzyme M protein
MVYNNHVINKFQKESLELEKIVNKNLKNKKIDEVGFYIMNLLRNGINREDSVSYEIAVSTLALILKETNDRSSIINYLRNHIDNETTLTFLKKIEKKYYNQIEDLSKKFDVGTLKAAILYTEPRRFTATDVSSTPEGISNLAISLLSLKKDDIILDLGSGVGSFLIKAAKSSKSENLYGVEINTTNVIISNLRKFITGLPIKVIQGNIISQDYSSLSANKVFSNYPLGMRLPMLENQLDKNTSLKKYFKEAKRTVSGDWIFGIAAYLNMNMPGKTVILMSNAGTWNKPDEVFRQKLLENGIVEGVILLPARLLSSTVIPLTMLILSHNNKEVRMVDASEIYTEGRRQNSLESKDVKKIIEAYHSKTKISKKVKLNEIAEQEYILNPQRYIGVDSGIINGISMGEISNTINRGAMIKSNELDRLISNEETNYHYLMLQNISNGVVESNLPSLVGIDNKYRKYCIRDKNLIISKISPFKVAMAHLKKDEVVLANGNLYFIELDEEKVNPIFIEIFLQSEAGISQLNRYAKGATMKSISIKDLKMIQIPNIPRAKQDQIAEEYENLCDELIVLQRQSDLIRDKKAKLLEEII